MAIILLTYSQCLQVLITVHGSIKVARLHIMVSNYNIALLEAPIRKLCDHPCWKKVSLAVPFSRA
jgi:hypothetical protein